MRAPKQGALPLALEKVRNFIAKQKAAKGLEVRLYAWPRRYGLRVAEIDLCRATNTSLAGVAYMQSDDGGALACFRAERLALNYQYKSPEEDTHESERLLVSALFNTK